MPLVDGEVRWLQSREQGIFLLHKSASSGRLDSLTGLRFFAAMAVVVLHVTQSFSIPNLVEHAAGLGYTGVTFFFLLSGFVLAWSARADEKRRLFYGRRMARVWPAHVATTLLVIPIIYYSGREPNWVAFPLVVALAHILVPDSSWYMAFNGVSWSLSAEAFFYACFPFLLRFASVGRRRANMLGISAAALLIAVAVAVLIATPDTKWGYLLYINPLYRLGEFASTLR